MREQWCNDAANQPQRCRIQRAQPSACTDSGGSSVQCAAVYVVSGFVRASIAARNYTNANSQTAITVGPQPGAAPVFGRGKAAKQSKAPQNQGRKEVSVAWEGCVKSQRVLLRRVWGSRQTRTKLPSPIMRLFQSFGTLYFPHGHSQRHPETSGRRLVTKIGRVARVRWRARGRILGRATAPVHIFERTTAALRAVLQNSATRA